MSKPESIKIQPWTDFPRQPCAFISDDFVHDKLAVLKVNSKNDRSTVNVKASVSADKSGVKSISDEVKLWFNLDQNRAIYTRLKSSNYLKVHYDHGVVESYGRKWNFYASLNTNKVLENLSVRLGVAHLSEKCHSDNRIKIDLGAQNRHNVTWYHRTLVNQNNFTFGVLSAYGLLQNILVKNNLMVGYKFDKNSSVYLRAENDGYRQTAINPIDWRAYFDTIKFDYIGSYNSNIKYGAEVVFRTKTDFLKELVLVGQHYEESRKLTTKLSLSSNLKANVDASLLLKFPSPVFNNIATVSLGLHGSNLVNEKRAFKYGGLIEFNV